MGAPGTTLGSPPFRPWPDCRRATPPRSRRSRPTSAAPASAPSSRPIPSCIEAYWHTGKIILDRQQEAAWGAKVIDRLAADLREAFPDMGGLSARNLLSMKLFAAAFPDGPIAKQPVSQLPWGQVIRLIQMVKDPAARDFYIQRDPHPRLEPQHPGNPNPEPAPPPRWQGPEQLRPHHAPGGVRPRRAALQRPLPLRLPRHRRSRAARPRSSRPSSITSSSSSSSSAPASPSSGGRSIWKSADDDFYLDLLFYHLKLRRYVVIELKARAFIPGDVGQINLYRAAVDDLLRHPDDQPTIGLLLCRGKNKLVVEYALSGLEQSIAVADWKTQITETLPAEFRGSLPTVAEIEAELAGKTFTRQAE